MPTTIKLGSITATVTKKDIKNIHLSVYPPKGQVRISAPKHMHLDTIRVFAISKLSWIKKEQKKIREQERETPREYVNRESHYIWGKRYLLKTVIRDEPPAIELKQNKLILYVRPKTSKVKKQEIFAQWHRELIKTAAPKLITKWEPRMKVSVDRFFVQKMKTKWGSCNPEAGSIRLNSELVRKPPECLEYIVVHEMVHLLEPTHNSRFVGFMDKFLPKWRFLRDELNRLPVSHEDWVY